MGGMHASLGRLFTVALKVALHEYSLVTIPSYVHHPCKCSLVTILFPAMRIDGGQVRHENVGKGTFMKGDRSMEMVSERSYDLCGFALLCRCSDNAGIEGHTFCVHNKV